MKSLSVKKVFLALAVLAALFAFVTVTACAEDYGNFSYTTVEPGDGEDFEPYIEIVSYKVSDESTDTVVVIPSEIEDVPVTKICASAFSWKETLTEIIIPDTVTVIENAAFYNCPDLKVVVIPDSVTYIGESAFQNCSSLEYVLLGNGLTEIGDIAFKDCSSLAYLDLGDSVKIVGDGAFFGCESLKNVYIPASVEEIGSFAFGFIQNGNVERVVDGFAFFTDANDALYAYNNRYSAVDPEVSGATSFTVFPITSGVKVCGDDSHSVSFATIRPATDTYEGLDAAACSVCHKIVTRPNTDIANTNSGASEWTTLILSVIAIIVLVILAVLYIKKSKKRRAEAIAAYQAGKPVPGQEERDQLEAKVAAKYEKKREKQLAKLKSYGVIGDDLTSTKDDADKAKDNKKTAKKK